MLAKCIFVSKKCLLWIFFLLILWTIFLFIHQSFRVEDFLSRKDLVCTSNVNNTQKTKLEEIEVVQRKEPKLKYEKLRRRMINIAQELTFLLKSEDFKMVYSFPIMPSQKKMVDYLLSLSLEHKNHIAKDLKELAKVDGFADWRKREFKSLSRLVQQRLRFLQYPRKCEEAKKLVCGMKTNNRDFGTHVHDLVTCLITAYGTQRTLIIHNTENQMRENKWNDIFLPSSSCQSMTKPTKWNIASSQNFEIELNDWKEPPYNPHAVPEDLAPRIKRLNGNPAAWWIGQMLKFLLRPVPEIKKQWQSLANEIYFISPIVGIHIDQTETSPITIQEYMKPAGDFFDHLELSKPIKKRRVFLSCANQTFFNKVRMYYPNYEFLGNSKSTLYGYGMDLYFLSRTDHLICRFSSSFCKVAYEMMQSKSPDPSTWYTSLDDMWKFSGTILKVVVMNHDAATSDELSLKKGDKVYVTRDLQEGFSEGYAEKDMKKYGIFPTFKLENFVETIQFPTYIEVTEILTKGVETSSGPNTEAKITG